MFADEKKEAKQKKKSDGQTVSQDVGGFPLLSWKAVFQFRIVCQLQP